MFRRAVPERNELGLQTRFAWNKKNIIFYFYDLSGARKIFEQRIEKYIGPDKINMEFN
jgi:hypothetical protein